MRDCGNAEKNKICYFWRNHKNNTQNSKKKYSEAETNLSNSKIAKRSMYHACINISNVSSKSLPEFNSPLDSARVSIDIDDSASIEVHSSQPASFIRVLPTIAAVFAFHCRVVTALLHESTIRRATTVTGQTGQCMRGLAAIS